MFDKTIIQQGRTVYQDRLVPIDASRAATLLKDVEEKAQRRITEAITIEGNGITALLQLERECHTDTLRGHLTCDINGTRIVLDESVPLSHDVMELVDKLRSALADTISSAVIGPAFAAAMRSRRIVPAYQSAQPIGDYR